MSLSASPGVRRSMWFAAAILAVVVFSLVFSASAYAADFVVKPGAPCSDTSPSSQYCTIQAAIDAAAAGDTINIFPGVYNETAAGRTLYNGTGPYQFGLFIAKNGIKMQGVTAAGVAVEVPTTVMARINTNSTTNFGPSGIWVEGNDVTIAGLEIGTNLVGQNKTIEIVGNGFVLKNSYINDPEGSVYFGDPRFSAGTSYIQSYRIENNIFGPGVSLDLTNGTGLSGPVSGRVVQSNLFKAIATQYWPGISFSGSGTGVPWFVNDVGGAEITDNTFEATDQYIRARGNYPNAQFDWASFWNDNHFPKAAVALAGASGFDLRTFTYPNDYGTHINVRRIAGLIQPQIDVAVAGDTVLVKAGTYVEQLSIAKDLTIKGAGSATVVQSPALLTAKVIEGVSRKPVVYAENANVVLRDLTVDGAGLGNANNSFIGVAYSNAGGAIESVEIKNIQDTPFSGVQHGVALLARVYDGSTRALLVKGVNLHDFQKNGTAFKSSGASTFTVDMLNSTITGAGSTTVTAQNGIEYNQADGTLKGTVRGNTITGISYNNTAASIKWVATSILNFYAALDISDNTISDAHMGIYLIDAPGKVIGNTLNISHAAAASTDGFGIIATDPPGVVPSPLPDESLVTATDGMMTPAAMDSVLAVEVSRNNVTFVGATNSTSTVGIEADAGWGANSIAFTANGNVVTGFDYGFYFGKCGTPYTCYAGVFTSAEVHYNSILGSTEFGMSSTLGNPTINAENNWWGNVAGPVAPNGIDGSGGAVDYEPLLTSVPSPVLSIPATPVVLNTGTNTFDLPILFTPGGAGFNSMSFAIDYDESCLLATAVTPGYPVNFGPGGSINSGNTAGEISFVLFDQSSGATIIPGGTLATISFNVLPACAQPKVAVNFAATPIPSCGIAGTSEGVECMAQGALITLDTNAPVTDVTLTPGMVEENVAVGTVVGALAAADADGTGPTFSLVAGDGSADNGSFEVDGANLKITVSPDFEAKSVYFVRVQADDGRGSVFAKALTVYVLNVNEAPLTIALSNNRVAEGKPIGTLVGSFSTSGDPDAGTAFTYALVTGSGDTDNTKFQIVPGTNLLLTNVILSNGTYSIRVRSTDNDNPLLNKEQVFSIIVLDTANLSVPARPPFNNVVRKSHTIDIPVAYAANDNVATDLAFDLNYGTACLDYQSAVGGTVTEPSDGVLHVVVAGAPILTGDVTTLTFRAKTLAEGCPAAGPSFKRSDVPLTFSNESLLEGSLSLAIASQPGTVIVINNDARGDCNSDAKVNAGDFTAIVLEYFDGDTSGSNWLDTTLIIPFDGSPYGCDANAGGSVLIADVSCTVSVVFGDSACTTGSVQAASIAPALVAVDNNMEVNVGRVLEVPVMLESAGNGISALAFTFKFDPALVSFNPADADGDGLPDALRFNVQGNLLRVAVYNEAKHELQVAVAGMSYPLTSFKDGPMVTVSLTGAADGKVSPLLKGVSAGSVEGLDVPVLVKSGGVTSGTTRVLLPTVNR